MIISPDNEEGGMIDFHQTKNNLGLCFCSQCSFKSQVTPFANMLPAHEHYDVESLTSIHEDAPLKLLTPLHCVPILFCVYICPLFNFFV